MPQIVGKEVGPIGYGMMGLTWRPVVTPMDECIDTLRAAVEKGCTLWNGGEFYGPPEMNSTTVLKHYFAKYPEDLDKVTVIMKGAANLQTAGPDGSPAAIRRSLDTIIENMAPKKLDVFCIARRDPKYPLDVTLGIIQKEYIDTGKIGGVGISEVRAETIHEAAKHIKVAVVEVELSMFSPDILKNGVVAACAQYDIPIAAYSPIGRGMLSGRFREAADFQSRGRIANFPRFQEQHWDHNMKLVHQVEALAKKKGCTPAQLAIGWVSGLSGRPGLPTIMPIPGATARSRVEENSTLISLTDEEAQGIREMVDSFEPAGGRYPEGAPTLT